MEKINCSYIISYIFSFLNDRTKLDLIKSNKQLQKIIDISIINDSIFSGKYRIIDEKGDGIEYNIFNEEIIFEGKYLKGKRNGKGKEYNDKGKLIFEGEYLKGKKNGIGIEYHNNGKIKFNGEYKEGKKWNGKAYNYFEILISEFKEEKGFIEEYDKWGHLIFDNQYENGEKNGIGNEYCYTHNFQYEFSLEYKNGKKWNGKREFNVEETKIVRYNNFTGQFAYELKNGNGYI